MPTLRAAAVDVDRRRFTTSAAPALMLILTPLGDNMPHSHPAGGHRFVDRDRP
jgi:hypothetical protein